MATKEYFPGIGKIKFEGVESRNPMAFRYYDAEKVVMGKKMKDWLKFSMAWWHTLCAEGGDQFGGGTKKFPWNVATDMALAEENLDLVTFSYNEGKSSMADVLSAQLSWTQAHTNLINAHLAEKMAVAEYKKVISE